jgi:osmotically-inducible protein OsmY
MSKRYGERGSGRYGDSEEDRTDDRDYEERDAGRAYGDAGERYGRGPEYGAMRRGGYSSARGGDYGRERDHDTRDHGSRDYFAREYGSRYGSRDYGSGEYQPRYGRDGLSGGYADSQPRRYEGEDYGRDRAPRAYGREPVREPARDYDRGERGRSRGVHDDEGVRDYDTDYGRTTSRFYGRSGYEYGREDYDHDDARDSRGEYARRGDERGEHGRGWLDRAADEVRSWFGGDDGPEGRGRGEAVRAGAGRGEGRFRGRGPRNYRRSDERVREEVCDRLTDNEWLDASDVEVSLVAGEVILTGTVDSRYAKRLAENIAESVAGVENVQNNLRVHNYQTGTPETAAPVTSPSLGASDVTGTPAALTAPAAPESDTGDAHTPTTRHSSSRAAGGS